MAINIKNEAVCDLVKELAARDGVSYTAAIESATRGALSTMTPSEDEALLAQIDAIARAYRANLTEPLDQDALYDENGLYA
jgi:hypothetical protein